MATTITVFWAMAFLLLGQRLFSLINTYNFLRSLRRSRLKPRNDFTPPVALIIPCKGLEEDFEANVAGFLGQDYPDYQVIFSLASADDPAYLATKNYLEKVSRNKQNREENAFRPQPDETRQVAPRDGADNEVRTALVIAGYPESRAEKVQNLLRGLEAVETKSAILVFADIDGRPKRDWLRSLVAGLEDPRVTVSTGYRWYLPASGLVSRLRSAWDASNATFLGDHGYNFAWGGSMAVRRADFKGMAVAERYWANAVSDDLTLTRAVRDWGGKVRFEPRCLVGSGGGETSWSKFLRWSTRQWAITRVYWPGLWWSGVATTGLYCSEVLFGLVLMALPGVSSVQRLFVAGALLLTHLLLAGKGLIHTTVAKEAFPEEATRLKRCGACYWQLSGLVPWVTWTNLLLSSFTRQIEWRGTRYEMRSANQTRVIRRGE
jgi:cellulose synthase/poly-beta-1,6-N-acetylglucosamine synthase-like glycosyltransferase